MRGEKGLADYIRGRHQAARALWPMLNARLAFDVLCQVESNIACFRSNTDDCDDQLIQIRPRYGRRQLSSGILGRRRKTMAACHYHGPGQRPRYLQLLDAIEAMSR